MSPGLALAGTDKPVAHSSTVARRHDLAPVDTGFVSAIRSLSEWFELDSKSAHQAWFAPRPTATPSRSTYAPAHP
jgi:hypothetical protein